MELVKFHLLDMEENLPSIKQGLEAKLDSLVMRDLYSKYKTAPTEEEREQARKAVLLSQKARYMRKGYSMLKIKDLRVKDFWTK